ncbi:MAG: DUF2076 domain-containing protein [Rhodovulum sulfidophilum]|uniref:DUF2076 domain-containing protein n=1 Tax=Rhodovulum sulfidophilum TaxID=35806 RepID=A0A2W5NC72_RHOSU|nr:MAG: DUF2076 domain-containing protein [Rhodovulum sulfidophilum]
MDRNDQQAIEGLFTRLAEAERGAPARDAEAEGFITRAIAAQPGAPYYMLQTIVVQQAALEQAQARIEALETERAQAPAGGGGFLASLFGGGAARPAPRPAQANGPATQALRAQHQQGGGGGFLAGAAQTAVGVAGGVLLGNAVMGMFAGDPAMAEEPPLEEEPAEEEMDFGGDFE